MLKFTVLGQFESLNMDWSHFKDWWRLKKWRKYRRASDIDAQSSDSMCYCDDCLNEFEVNITSILE